MISSYATNTLSTTGSSTEDFLSSPNEQGRFTLQLDLNDMAAGDVIEVRAYKMVRASGTQRVCAFTAYYGAQPAYGLVVIPFDGIDNSLTDSNALRFSITQTFGTAGISIPWTVLKEDALAPTTTGRTADVTATGAVGIDWGNVENPTTSVAFTGTTIATTQKVDLETIKTNPVVNAGTVTFPTTATLASTTNITAGTVTTATNVTTVNGIAAGAITAAAIATDAIDADALAANAVTEIAAGISIPSAANIATEILDTQEMETGYSLRKSWKLLLAIIAGRTSGHPTAPIFRDILNTKNRATVTLDDDGNRSAVTIDVT